MRSKQKHIAGKVIVALIFAAFTPGMVLGQSVRSDSGQPDKRAQYDSLCSIAARQREHVPRIVNNPLAEIEPNDSPEIAQVISIQTANGGENLEIEGELAVASDVDYFRATLAKGDILGMVLFGLGNPDTILAIADANGTEIMSNDDHFDLADHFPAGSPFPGGSSDPDSILNWIAPHDGDFLIRATSDGTTSGFYFLRIIARRPALETRSLPAVQTVFVDFDGATLNAEALFGVTGNTQATLSPLQSFLPSFGLSVLFEDQVIDSILAVIQENFDDLRVPELNGYRPDDGIEGHYNVIIRNSRDHPDGFGLGDVTRVIIGGTQAQLGLNSIGVSQSIDPGNFQTDDTVVVLLDALSDGMVANIPRDPSVDLVDAIGRVVGNVASHELGHALGSWHTEGSNAIPSLMDVSGTVANLYGGVGSDGIMGTSDDTDPDFVEDAFLIMDVFDGAQRPDVRAAFGLSTGPACPAAPACNDLDVCTRDELIGESCTQLPNLYGDVNRSGAIDVFDVLCSLDAFAGAPSNCTVTDADIADCTADCVIDVFDILAVLDAFGGNDPCCGS